MSSRVVSPKHRVKLAVALALLAALPAFSARREVPQDKQTATSNQGSSQKPSSQQSNGEKKFKQNCSRCHEAPVGFSPRISGTVLRHMRVRASLSKQDEEDILRFLNPQ